MRRLVLLAAVMSLGSCGGGPEKIECAVGTTDSYFCNDTTESYRCPAGSAADAKVNADLDAACIAEGGSDTNAIAQCMMKASQEGKYRMAPAQFVEDCTATGKTCDWAGSGHCIDKK